MVSPGPGIDSRSARLQAGICMSPRCPPEGGRYNGPSRNACLTMGSVAARGREKRRMSKNSTGRKVETAFGCLVAFLIGFGARGLAHYGRIHPSSDLGFDAFDKRLMMLAGGLALGLAVIVVRRISRER